MASSSEAFDLSATVRVVARQLRENVEIKDRTYHLRTYKVNKAFLLRDASTAERKRLQQFIRFGKVRLSCSDNYYCRVALPVCILLCIFQACFIGSEAVAWMLSSGVASNEAEAVQLGNMLLQEKLIAHVLEEHTFENGFFFYRFTAENQEARKEEASRSKPVRVQSVFVRCVQLPCFLFCSCLKFMEVSSSCPAELSRWLLSRALLHSWYVGLAEILVEVEGIL